MLEDNGLAINAQWRGIYFGIVASESDTGNAFAQDLAFGGRLDFAKLTRVGALDGLAGFGEVLTAGWPLPQKEFIEQSLARLFANNAAAIAEAVGANIPFGSSLSAWGGALQIKPAGWQYTKLGLFMTYPDPTAASNNGLMLQGLPT